MRFNNAFGLLAGLHQLAYPKPVNGFAGPLTGENEQLEIRAPPPAAVCDKLNSIISVLKSYQATPFCSSFLNIPASTISTTTYLPQFTTTTSTVFSSTSTTTATSTQWVYCIARSRFYSNSR
jgi:hypothetical protein